jgi:hypothetical protein
MSKHKIVTFRKDMPCHNCIHRIDDKTCKAYPNGIPEYYNNGSNIHTIKKPDQVGDFLLEETEEYKKRMEEISKKANKKK